MILIADSKKPNWNAIRAEYIAGNIGQRKLAVKYGVSVNTLIKKANKEKWADQRNATYNECTAVVQQKTASAVADNAVKLEEARAAAIEVARAGIERLRTLQGSKVSTRQKDGKGNPVTVDFDLLNMVTALEKLQRMGVGDVNAEPVRVIIDV